MSKINQTYLCTPKFYAAANSLEFQFYNWELCRRKSTDLEIVFNITQVEIAVDSVNGIGENTSSVRIQHEVNFW